MACFVSALACKWDSFCIYLLQGLLFCVFIGGFLFFFFLNDPNCNPKVSGSSVPKYKMAVCAEHKSLKNKKDLGHIQAQSIEGCGVQFQTHASRSLLFSAVFYHAPFQ